MLSTLALALAPLPVCPVAPLPTPHLAGLGADEVVFATGPRFEGVRLRTIRVERDLTFDSMSATMNGEEVPAEFLPALEIEIGSVAHLAVRDEALEPGSHLALRRTFVTIEGEQQVYVAQAGDVMDDRTAEPRSPLAGKTVRFERDAVDEAFEASLEEKGAGDPPRGLRFDLDLTGLLPGKAVEPGDSWEAPSAALDSLLVPGGEVLWAWSEDFEDSDWEEWDGEWEQAGALSVKFAGWVAGAEGRLARLAVEGDVSATRSQPSDLEDVPVVDGPGTEAEERTHRWEGEVVWSVPEQRLHEASLRAELTSTVTLATNEGAPMPFDSTVFLRGEVTLAAQVTRE